MTDTDVSKIIKFGQEPESSGSLFVAEIDAQMHTDDEGNVESSFLPGDEVYFLLHCGPEVTVQGVWDTAGGDIQRIGTVVRSKTEEMGFTHPADTGELSHIPVGIPVASWYGRSSVLQLDDRQLSAVSAPVLGDITHSFTAVQYKYRLPPGVQLTIGVGESFPVDIVIKTEG